METILQFGTGNFLRAFADDFLDRMNRLGLYDGKAVIVSPTDSAAVGKINAQSGRYHLLLRGIGEAGEVRELREISSVTRAVNPYRSFDEFLTLAKNADLRIIISNTTEAGIAFDETCRFDDAPPASFPGKLTRFLFERYRCGLPGFLLLPCELIDENGVRLRECVEQYIGLWDLPDPFRRWVAEENVFCSTLVDRIVTGFPAADAAELFEEIGGEDALLDTAEPYHLWVIEGDFEQELPLKKAGVNVIWTRDAAPYKKMKVRILNGLHTSMVFPGLLAGLETVADCMGDRDLRPFIERVLTKRILPTLPDDEAIRAFAEAVTRRFENPYLHHKLRSIALNSVSKFTVRVLPTAEDCIAAKGAVPKEFALSLAALIEYYKTNEVADDPKAARFIRENDAAAILKNTALWGRDLSSFLPAVEECGEILRRDAREAIRWSIL